VKNVKGYAWTALPIGHLAQHQLDRLFVADQVVVDDEGDLHALGTQGPSSFADDVFGGLDARPFRPKRHDDVAELALKGAAARKNWMLPKR